MAANFSAVSCARTEGRESSGHTSYHTATSGAGMGLANQAQIQANHYETYRNWTGVRRRWNSTWYTKQK
eukprot:3357436-Amphidinium_carterae.2